MMACSKNANYLYYLARGRCPACNGMRMLVPGKKTCAVCAEKKAAQCKARRERLKAAGLCTRCGKRQPVAGILLCQICREKEHGDYERYHRNTQKPQREALTAEGICTQCRVKFAEPGRTRCRECMDKQRKYLKQYDPTGEKRRAQIQGYIDAGICRDCGAKPAEPGRKSCAACYERRRDSTRKYKLTRRIARDIEETRRRLINENQNGAGRVSAHPNASD